MYNNNMRDFRVLFNAINELYAEKLINKNNIEIHYAGTDYDKVQKQAKETNCMDIIYNHGYLNTSEVFELQCKMDIFVVLSWCNKVDGKGGVTGKFYEGIRAKKPILSLISGDSTGSELFELNKKYNYGFCYEEASCNVRLLKDYIINVYNCKIKYKKVLYNPNTKLFEDFKYSNLTNKLLNAFSSIIKKNL